MKLFVEATIPPGVRLLVCGDASIAITIPPETADLLAADLVRAAATARDMASRVTTRPMCTRCLRDCSVCICSSARKGGAA